MASMLTILRKHPSTLTPSLTNGFFRRAASNVSIKQQHDTELREWLRDSGAMDVKHGPVNIMAEPLSVPPPTCLSKDDETTTKIIHFQRHGQGYHNLLYVVLNDVGQPVLDIYDPNPKVNPFVRPEIVDAPLTEHGRAQCANKRSEASLLTPELVVVSPLHRAIQTAQSSWADFMYEIPFVAHEGLREELGVLVCNKRRPLSETKLEFPGIDFSYMQGSDEDDLWHPTERESPVNKSKRIYEFLVDFVRNRPEKEIAVVGHSAWLFNMCNTSVMDCGDDESLKSWFGTSEIRSMRVKFSGG